ncbi:hypothetical protein MKEN_00721500 [Mycena kentingensis (nom. inval.)]|nr:hypothetical protein MKEN_00721500 [Mycena kentingensis (nom. inval.)]
MSSARLAPNSQPPLDAHVLLAALGFPLVDQQRYPTSNLTGPACISTALRFGLVLGSKSPPPRRHILSSMPDVDQMNLRRRKHTSRLLPCGCFANGRPSGFSATSRALVCPTSDGALYAGLKLIRAAWRGYLVELLPPEASSAPRYSSPAVPGASLALCIRPRHQYNGMTVDTGAPSPIPGLPIPASVCAGFAAGGKRGGSQSKKTAPVLPLALRCYLRLLPPEARVSDSQSIKTAPASPLALPLHSLSAPRSDVTTPSRFHMFRHRR